MIASNKRKNFNRNPEGYNQKADIFSINYFFSPIIKKFNFQVELLKVNLGS
jgi:hypothetical protein